VSHGFFGCWGEEKRGVSWLLLYPHLVFFIVLSWVFWDKDTVASWYRESDREQSTEKISFFE
jgi:hypothetical protein